MRNNYRRSYKKRIVNKLFRVPLCLCFKASLSEKKIDLHENETACRTHFHMKGFALKLVLKKRDKGTRKWPIISSRRKRRHIFSCLSFKVSSQFQLVHQKVDKKLSKYGKTIKNLASDESSLNASLKLFTNLSVSRRRFKPFV